MRSWSDSQGSSRAPGRDAGHATAAHPRRDAQGPEDRPGLVRDPQGSRAVPRGSEGMTRRLYGTGSVYQRRGRWVAAISVNGKRREMMFATRELAEASFSKRARIRSSDLDVPAHPQPDVGGPGGCMGHATPGKATSEAGGWTLAGRRRRRRGPRCGLSSPRSCVQRWWAAGDSNSRTSCMSSKAGRKSGVNRPQPILSRIVSRSPTAGLWLDRATGIQGCRG